MITERESYWETERGERREERGERKRRKVSSPESGWNRIGGKLGILVAGNVDW